MCAHRFYATTWALQCIHTYVCVHMIVFVHNYKQAYIGIVIVKCSVQKSLPGYACMNT